MRLRIRSRQRLADHRKLIGSGPFQPQSPRSRLFVVLIIVAFFVYGDQPKLGASPGELLSFFHGDRTRILIATVIFCFAFLELLWFGAALSSVLRDAGMAGWGAAATASSAALGAILFFRMTVRAGLAFSIADLGHL